MRWLKLTLALVLLVPAWAVLGAYAALDSGTSPWVGLAVGGLVGAVFGLMMGRRSQVAGVGLGVRAAGGR